MEQILDSGHIGQVSGDTRVQVPYTIRFLDESALNDIMDLQQVIVLNLSRPDLLQPFPAEFMKLHFEKKGRVMGVFSESKLVAFRCIYYPDVDEEEWNLGHDLGLSTDEMKRTANFQMVCVHPDYRGNSLAMKMNRQLFRLLREEGKYRHLCATVHPFNYWSLSILFRCGFIVKTLKHKYGGKLRYIVYQDLRDEQPAAPAESIETPLLDIGKQKELLEAGYIGVALKKDKDNNFFIAMAR